MNWSSVCLVKAAAWLTLPARTRSDHIYLLTSLKLSFVLILKKPIVIVLYSKSSLKKERERGKHTLLCFGESPGLSDDNVKVFPLAAFDTLLKELGLG